MLLLLLPAVARVVVVVVVVAVAVAVALCVASVSPYDCARLGVYVCEWCRRIATV
jgi:hypothetical protein